MYRLNTFTIQIHQTNRNQFSSPTIHYIHFSEPFDSRLLGASHDPCTSTRRPTYNSNDSICGTRKPERNRWRPSKTVTPIDWQAMRRYRMTGDDCLLTMRRTATAIWWWRWWCRSPGLIWNNIWYICAHGDIFLRLKCRCWRGIGVWNVSISSNNPIVAKKKAFKVVVKISLRIVVKSYFYYFYLNEYSFLLILGLFLPTV